MRRSRDYKDPRGAHVRLYKDILLSAAWRSLSFTEQAIYVAMRSVLGANNNGNIAATLSDMKKHNIRSSSTLAKGLRSLETVGLIAKTRQGGITMGNKFCSLYRFTDEAVLDNPQLGLKWRKATREWEEFKSVADCQRALAIEHEKAKRPPEQKVATKLRQAERIDSNAEVQVPKIASIGEADASPALRETKTAVLH
jgi:hypothetical protein